jgi:hypothetical protein
LLKFENDVSIFTCEMFAAKSSGKRSSIKINEEITTDPNQAAKDRMNSCQLMVDVQITRLWHLVTVELNLLEIIS